jgi:hypothetical protein
MKHNYYSTNSFIILLHDVRQNTIMPGRSRVTHSVRTPEYQLSARAFRWGRRCWSNPVTATRYPIQRILHQANLPLGDMRVNLCRLHTLTTRELLDDANVHPLSMFISNLFEHDTGEIDIFRGLTVATP